jgi:hypothetical protein
VLHHSQFNYNFLGFCFLLVERFPGFAQFHFEDLQAAPSASQKRTVQIPETFQAIGKHQSVYLSVFLKIRKLKAFRVSGLGNYRIKKRQF